MAITDYDTMIVPISIEISLPDVEDNNIVLLTLNKRDGMKTGLVIPYDVLLPLSQGLNESLGMIEMQSLKHKKTPKD